MYPGYCTQQWYNQEKETEEKTTAENEKAE